MAAATIGSASPKLAWIGKAPSVPYFMTETGDSWTPVGHNDSITWPGLSGLLGMKDAASADAYLAMLARNGINCIRLMLEHAETPEGHFENPVGVFVPQMVELWDRLFAMCQRHGIHVLLTPFDTFWSRINWNDHPYNTRNGGPLDSPSRLLICGDTRKAIKQRLTFASERWGGTGTIFAWDLWNEIHPAQAEENIEGFSSFIHDLSHELRELETRLYGHAHLQTVSLFGPEIWRQPKLDLAEPIFRHPDLDIATIHIYPEGAVDDPTGTVAPAVDMGKIVADSILQIHDERPILDTEHGPHRFKDRHISPPERFDDEHFRHMQWAHLAAGGAGGGMRWPNRHPHLLTPGMHGAQLALAKFLPLIEWTRFRRKSISEHIGLSNPAVRAVSCADEQQALLWLVRTDSLGKSGALKTRAAPLPVTVTVPGLMPGVYQLTAWDTREGQPLAAWLSHVQEGPLSFGLELATDLAVAVHRRN